MDDLGVLNPPSIQVSYCGDGSTFVTKNDLRSKFNPILPRLFWSFSARGGCLVPPPVIPLSDLQSTWKLVHQYVWVKNTQTQKIIELFLEMMSQWHYFPFLQLLCFLSDFAQIFTEMPPLGMTNKNAKFCWDWLRNDVTMTSWQILRAQFVKSTLQRMCCHGNMKDCILIKFCIEVLIIISKHRSKFCADLLRNSVTVTLLLSWMG